MKPKQRQFAKIVKQLSEIDLKTYLGLKVSELAREKARSRVMRTDSTQRKIELIEHEFKALWDEGYSRNILAMSYSDLLKQTKDVADPETMRQIENNEVILLPGKNLGV